MLQQANDRGNGPGRGNAVPEKFTTHGHTIAFTVQAPTLIASKLAIPKENACRKHSSGLHLK
jgi:hypothetical protein